MDMNTKLKRMEKRIADTTNEYAKVLRGLDFVGDRLSITIEERELLSQAYHLLRRIEDDIQFEYEGNNEYMR